MKGIPIPKREIEERATAISDCKTRQMTFAEALDYDIAPREAMKKCLPSTTKEMTADRLAKCAQAGMTAKEIAQCFNTTESSVYTYCSKYKIRLGKNSVKKEATPADNLAQPSDDADEINLAECVLYGPDSRGVFGHIASPTITVSPKGYLRLSTQIGKTIPDNWGVLLYRSPNKAVIVKPVETGGIKPWRRRKETSRALLINHLKFVKDLGIERTTRLPARYSEKLQAWIGEQNPGASV